MGTRVNFQVPRLRIPPEEIAAREQEFRIRADREKLRERQEAFTVKLFEYARTNGLKGFTTLLELSTGMSYDFKPEDIEGGRFDYIHERATLFAEELYTSFINLNDTEILDEHLRRSAEGITRYIDHLSDYPDAYMEEILESLEIN